MNVNLNLVTVNFYLQLERVSMHRKLKQRCVYFLNVFVDSRDCAQAELNILDLKIKFTRPVCFL